MENNELVKRVLSFFEKCDLAVVSTVSQQGGSESALVAFSNTDNLEVIFGTSNASRKYKNIQNNPKVSFVIGWSRELGSVQYEGIASEVEKDDIPRLASIHTTKTPDSKKFVEGDDQRYFLVTPTWLRFTDNSINEVIEHTF